MAYIYRIRQKSTGLYSTGGFYPSKFNKTGKTWLSLNAVSTHIAGYANSLEWYKKNDKKAFKDPYEDCELVKIKLIEDEVKSMSDLLERSRRLKTLTKKYGEDLKILVDKIEKDDDPQFLWIVVSNRQNDFNKIIKQMKFKRADYRYCGKAFAFRNKDAAAMFRISLNGDTYSLYLPDLE